MCYSQFVSSNVCAMKHDPAIGMWRYRTKSEGFFDHGCWQKRTTDCARAQSRRAHCSDDRMTYPDYRDVIASAVAADDHFFMLDPTPHWRRDADDQRVPDERCERCRHRCNRRSGR